MNTDPKQLAREMAEKCAENIDQIFRGNHHRGWKDDFVGIILRELNLEQLIADKQRLVDAGQQVLQHFSAVHIDYVSGTKAGTNLRQAIDNAMKSQS